MNGWLQFVSKFKFLIAGILLFLVGFIYFENQKAPVFDPVSFQQAFLRKEAELQKELRQISNEKGGFSYLKKTKNFAFIYENEKLVAWNTNQLPVETYAAIQFPVNGVVHLQNGWYYSQTLRKGNRLYCLAFLIKREYGFKNEFIDSYTNPELSQTLVEIQMNAGKGTAIHDKHGKTLFYVQIAKKENTEVSLPLILLAFLGGIFSLKAFLFELVKRKNKHLLIFAFSLLIARYLSFYIPWKLLFGNVDFLSAQLFAYNEWFSHLLDFGLNSLTVLFLLLSFIHFRTTYKKLYAFIGSCLIWVTWYVILKWIQLLIFNSSVPLQPENLFALTAYSCFALILFGGFFRIYYLLLRKIENGISHENSKGLGLFLGISIIAIIVLFWFSLNYFYYLPILFLPLLHWSKKQFKQWHLPIIIAGFAAVFVVDIHFQNKEKDRETRALYARQLIVEQDINLELDFASIKSALEAEPLFSLAAEGKLSHLSLSDFGNILEKRYFKGIWEAYDNEFNLYDSSGVSILNPQTRKLAYFEKINQLKGENSQVDANMHFLRNVVSGYSYFIFLPLEHNNRKLTLFIGLKSKRIPEEIGFPRLLLSEKAKVLNTLDNYSIAKYTGGKLTTSFGEFNYPLSLNWLPGQEKEETSVNYKDYQHIAYIRNATVVILSVKNTSWLEFIAGFAYIFTLWGLSTLLIQFMSGYNPFGLSAFSFAYRIQLALVSLVVIALVLFGIGSGMYVRKQYEDFTNDNIHEKLHAVEEDIHDLTASSSYISTAENGDELESRLKRLATVFKTDLNVYNREGILVATSRAKIFNLGLLSEQMNPDAFLSLHNDGKSFYSHDEQIGKLSFISSYIPIANDGGKILGYVNLQYFGKQKEFEGQIQQFITAIINVFMLFLAISIVVALFVSNWLTASLRLLKQHLSGLRFGESNAKIPYAGNDEIGLIIKAYNEKLDDLEKAARQLAVNERESAWREMAKQVAHEIKNPLTPMKLGIQHLLRTYDPKDENANQRLVKVLHSMIEQIDGLTRIANEFSNFARLPEPHKTEGDLLEVIRHAVTIFENEQNVSIQLEENTSSANMSFDKDQWMQVFNNLLKNAVQATNGKEDAQIQVSIKKSSEDRAVLIAISDNGIGISDEEKEKIFTPHFTTKSTGSGIGLSLVRQIVEFHQGKISFESKSGVGTTFTIELPLNS